MSFHSVLHRIVKGAILQVRSLSKVAVVFTSLLIGSVANAEWQDPLESPALATQRAHESLLLDVTRAGNRLVAVGSHGHIVYSDDSGVTWKQAKTPSAVTLTAVDFASPQLGWAVGHDGLILHSSDAGQTWSRQFDGYLANKAIVKAARANKEEATLALDEARNSGDAALIDAAEMQLENSTYALEDAQYDQQSGSTKPFLDVWFYDAKRGFAVGAYGMVFHTRNGGQDWADWSGHVDNPDRLHINSIAMVGPRSLMVVGEQGMILRSDDMGENWRSLPSPYEGSFFGVLAKSGNILIFGLRGNLFHSVDGGAQWNKLYTNAEQTLMSGVVRADKTAVLVGNGGSVIFLDRRFGNPEAITLPGRISSAAATQAPDGSIILVGESGVGRIDQKGVVIEGAITMAEGDF